MIFKSLPQSWLCVWLSCVLSVLLPATPALVSFFPNEARCEERDPADASEEVEVGEVTLSDSGRMQRRSRREQMATRRASGETQNRSPSLSNLGTCMPPPGQASLWGRFGPLHC